MRAITNNNRQWDATFQHLLRTRQQLVELTGRLPSNCTMAQLEAYSMEAAPLEASIEQDLAQLAAINTELESQSEAAAA